MLKKAFIIFLLAFSQILSYNAEAIVIDRRPITVGVSYLQENETTKIMLKGIKDAAKKMKAQIILRDGRGEEDIQIAQIHDLIAQETKCLVIICDSQKINSQIAEKGNKIGTPIVLVESNTLDKKNSYQSAYNALINACNQFKAKPIKPAFYSDSY